MPVIRFGISRAAMIFCIFALASSFAGHSLALEDLRSSCPDVPDESVLSHLVDDLSIPGRDSKPGSKWIAVPQELHPARVSSFGVRLADVPIEAPRSLPVFGSRRDRAPPLS